MLNKILPSLLQKNLVYPEVIKLPEIICWDLPNKSLIMNLLCENHHLNSERVSNNVDKLIKNYSKCRNYFEVHKNMPNTVQTSLDMLL